MEICCDFVLGESSMAGLDNIEYVHCNNCGGERKHTILHVDKYARDYPTSHPDITVTEFHSTTTLKCGGCEAVQLKRVFRFSEEDEATVEFFPSPMPRPLPGWMRQLDRTKSEEAYIHELLTQIYAALAAGACTVSAMGVRALLEFVMVSKVGDQGTFAKNLDEFEKQGYVAKRERMRLESILDVGSAAIHRAFMVSPMDALTLLDIAEHQIESNYLHDEVVAHVSSKVPPRVRPSTSPKTKP